MDSKFIPDETDLSIGLSVTCSTAVDDTYCGDEVLVPQHAVPSASSLLMMHYTHENFPLYNSESLSHPLDISYNDSPINGHMNSDNEIDMYEQGVKHIITLDSYKLDRSDVSQETDVPYSSRILQPEGHKMQVCKACGKTFKFQTSLLRHNNKVHISRYQCSTCCRVFSRQSYLDVHTSKPGTSCFVEHKDKSKRRR